MLRNHGGSTDGSTCTKQQFEHVLVKLEDGRKLEESLYWDFIALDENGNRTVSVKNCLLLAKLVFFLYYFYVRGRVRVMYLEPIIKLK